MCARTPGRHDHGVETAASGLQNQYLPGVLERHSASGVVSRKCGHQAHDHVGLEEASFVEFIGDILSGEPGISKDLAVLRIQDDRITALS